MQQLCARWHNCCAAAAAIVRWRRRRRGFGRDVGVGVGVGVNVEAEFEAEAALEADEGAIDWPPNETTVLTRRRTLAERYETFSHAQVSGHR